MLHFCHKPSTVSEIDWITFCWLIYYLISVILSWSQLVLLDYQQLKSKILKCIPTQWSLIFPADFAFQVLVVPMRTRSLASEGARTRPARLRWCWKKLLRCPRRYPRTSRCPWAAAPRWAASCRASPTPYRLTCPPSRSPSPSPPSRRPAPPRRRWQSNPTSARLSRRCFWV